MIHRLGAVSDSAERRVCGHAGGASQEGLSPSHSLLNVSLKCWGRLSADVCIMASSGYVMFVRDVCVCVCVCVHAGVCVCVLCCVVICSLVNAAESNPAELG